MSDKSLKMSKIWEAYFTEDQNFTIERYGNQGHAAHWGRVPGTSLLKLYFPQFIMRTEPAHRWILLPKKGKTTFA